METMHNLIQQLVAFERPTWGDVSRGIPAWHPVCEDPPGDDGTGGDDGADGADGSKGDPPKDKAQAAVDKAYEKLREAEKENRELKARATAAERAKMDDLEKAKAEAADRAAEAGVLQGRLDEIEWRGNVEEIATSMKFKKPRVAVRFVPTEAKTTKQIKAALTEASEDIPELIGTGATPPPVNPGGGSAGSPNQRMNSMLRRAAGRGA